MNRIRLSTTVDAELLSNARSVRAGITDAALVDEALGALLARHRAAEVDASYAAYDEHPVDEPDEWGDLSSWRRASRAPRDVALPPRRAVWCHMAEIRAGTQSLCYRATRRPSPATRTWRTMYHGYLADSPARSPLTPVTDPLPRRSVVNLDSVESVSVAVLVSRLGRLADTQMRAICAALEVAVDFPG